MASQTPPVPPQGVWPREQRRKPADGSESYWSPGYSLAGTFGKLEAPWPLCEVIASLSIIVAGQIQQTLPDKRIGFVGEFSYVPSPLLVELMVQFSLTTRALAVVPSCFRPISQHSFSEDRTRCTDRLRIFNRRSFEGRPPLPDRPD